MPSNIAVPAPLAAKGRLIVAGSADERQGAAYPARAFPAWAAETRPAWGRLYAILPVTAGLSLAAHRLFPEGAWRTAGELGVAAITVLLFALWIAANRHTRARQEPPAGTPPVRILYCYRPPSPQPAPVADRSAAPRDRDRLAGEPAALSPEATPHR